MKLYYVIFALVTLLCQMGTVHPGPENEEPPTEPEDTKDPGPEPNEPEPPTEPENPGEPAPDSKKTEPEPKDEPPTEPESPKVPEPPKMCDELGGHCEEDCHPEHMLAGTGCAQDEACCKHD